MKKFICIGIILTMIVIFPVSACANDINTLSAECAILATENGDILFEKNADARYSPASVTKITTALLVVRAVKEGKISYSDVVVVSEHAANKTGSHIYLSPGENITVHDLMKGLMVSSGNDAAVALAEFVAGSESEFVKQMNMCAKELGMENTNYENVNGLDSENHYSCARDIMKVTMELLKYPEITDFTTIWMDTIRNGEFQLSNTNKLIRFYDGATGMKTGFTSKSGYCVSATAKRNNLGLIAVVLKAPTSKDRFSDASTMLNYGFNLYENINVLEKDKEHTSIDVEKGYEEKLSVVYEKDFNTVVPKGKRESVTYEIKGLPQTIKAPVEKGQVLGFAEIYNNDKKVAEINLIAKDEIKKVSLWYMFCKFFYSLTEFIV